MLIKDLPNNCKPREKALMKGIEYLGDDELLAILLRTGYKNTSAKDLAVNVLLELDNLNNFEDLTTNKIARIKGVGITKAITILAALELGKRYTQRQVDCSVTLNNTDKVYFYLRNKFSESKQEEFITVLLDNKKRIIGDKTIFKGDLNSVNVHPREIFKYAITNSAAAIIISHNHPSGDVFPSKQDIKITKELIEAGKLLQIPVIDHIIIGKDKYYSFFESEIIQNEKNKSN